MSERYVYILYSEDGDSLVAVRNLSNVKEAVEQAKAEMEARPNVASFRVQGYPVNNPSNTRMIAAGNAYCTTWSSAVPRRVDILRVAYFNLYHVDEPIDLRLDMAETLCGDSITERGRALLELGERRGGMATTTYRGESNRLGLGRGSGPCRHCHQPRDFHMGDKEFCPSAELLAITAVPRTAEEMAKIKAMVLSDV